MCHWMYGVSVYSPSSSQAESLRGRCNIDRWSFKDLYLHHNTKLLRMLELIRFCSFIITMFSVIQQTASVRMMGFSLVQQSHQRSFFENRVVIIVDVLT